MSNRTQVALLELKKALANEEWMRGVQVTYDEVKCHDYPPTVDVKVLPEPNDG